MGVYFILLFVFAKLFAVPIKIAKFIQFVIW